MEKKITSQLTLCVPTLSVHIRSFLGRCCRSSQLFYEFQKLMKLIMMAANVYELVILYSGREMKAFPDYCESEILDSYPDMPQ